jgi:1,4-dihydroxy-2-naphthoyl-CoA hydrolase
MFNPDYTAESFNHKSRGLFPELVGMKIISIEANKIVAEMPITQKLFAPNGFVHAGSIITLADTAAGISTKAHLPQNARTFTTLELKSNFIRGQKEGVLIAESEPEHLGRTTQVWRVIVRDKASQKKVAIFSCTQLILY